MQNSSIEGPGWWWIGSGRTGYGVPPHSFRSEPEGQGAVKKYGESGIRPPSLFSFHEILKTRLIPGRR